MVGLANITLGSSVESQTIISIRYSKRGLVKMCMMMRRDGGLRDGIQVVNWECNGEQRIWI